MIDFSDKNKTYRLFDLVMKKYYINGDIIFNEKPRCEFIEMIKFIDYEINKTNQQRHNEIDKYESYIN